MVNVGSDAESSIQIRASIVWCTGRLVSLIVHRTLYGGFDPTNQQGYDRWGAKSSMVFLYRQYLTGMREAATWNFCILHKYVRWLLSIFISKFIHVCNCLTTIMYYTSIKATGPYTSLLRRRLQAASHCPQVDSPNMKFELFIFS